jgi:hypothetical protein
MRRIKKVLHDAILVELEPVYKKSSLLEIPGSEAVRIGRVLMVGSGKQYTDRFVPMPDIVGKRVAFMMMAVLMRSAQHRDLPENQVIVRMGDLLFEVDDGVDIEVMA